MKFKTKIIITILAIEIFFLLCGFIGYFNAKKQITRDAYNKLEIIAQIQKGRVQAILKIQQDLLSLFATKPLLSSYLKAYNIHPSSLLQKSMNDNLLEAKSHSVSIKKIFITNPVGTIVASTDPVLLGTDISSKDFFKQGIKKNNLSTFKKDNVGKSFQYLVGPIFLNGETLGTVIVVVDADGIIDLANDYSGLGNTGETLLVRNDGNGNALFLTPTRFDRDAALVRVILKEKTGIAALSAIAGEEKVFSNLLDYRNVSVFAATRYIKDVNWGIVAKIDQTEALAPVKELQRMVLFLVVIAGLFIILIGILISQSIISPIKKLTVRADKIARGDLSQSILVTSQDEIGMLGQVFNTMAKKLKESYSTLENRIRDRTRDLENAKIAGRNVLEDLQAEKEKLAEANAKDEALLASIGDGVTATDQNGKIILMNQAAGRMLGWSAEQTTGKLLADVWKVLDEKGNMVPDTKRPVILALKGKTTTTTTTTTGPSYFYTRKDGTTFPVAIMVTPVMINGKIIGVIDVFRDITHEKEVDKAKSEFVSLASHQLRTPLGITKWYLEVLGKESYLVKAPKTILDYFAEVVKNNERILALVRELLLVSRIDQGKIKDAPKLTNVIEVITDIVKNIKPIAQTKDVKLNLDIKEMKLQNMFIDTLRFREAIENLIVNSLEYTPAKGKVVVVVSKTNSNLSISIKDTGIGISTEDKKELFTKFFRSERAILRNPEGSGLGLYVVKSYIEEWGGKVSVTSAEGKGSTFTISLPISQKKNV